MSDHWRGRGCCGAGVIAILLALISPNGGMAQESSPPQPVPIANSERRALRSAVNGMAYQIDIALPRSYATSQKRYPVVYVLDGNVFFPVLSASNRLAASLLPSELIVIGIGYPIQEYGFWSREYNMSRARDYTPKPAKPVGGVSAGAGGAPAFLRFLGEELIPFIDSSYRTVPGDRGLMGHSYGGLFCAYVLTHEPSLFQKYAIGSPSLWWDDEAPFRWQAEYAAKHADLRARVYGYIGGIESEAGAARIQRFWAALRERHYAGLQLIEVSIVPDEIHTSVTLVAFEHALRKLYARSPVSLPIETMRRYTGDWKAGSEPSWKIRLAGERLVVEIPAYSTGPLEGQSARRRELLAGGDASFFTELGDMSIQFTIDTKAQSVSEMSVSMPQFGYASVHRRLPGAGESANRK